MTASPASASTGTPAPEFRDQVRSAVIWRSGTQIFSQLVAWASTFLVIRILSPSDYGLYAMTGVVMVLLGLFNGYSFANAVIQDRTAGKEQLRQLFGLLIVINGALATLQVATAPLVAAYFGQPMVTDLLRAQALIYLTNPFLALGYAVLSRQMDFRKQAQVNMASAVLGALTALAGALAGLGVWTLVVAPLVTFTSRAFGMAALARAFMWPSFDFRAARTIANYGGVVMLGQIFWFLQTQADIMVAGHVLTAGELGYYTTALFLAQLFVNKVVPPLNEVAFSAYARIQDDPAAVANGFLASVRVVMLLAIPFCLGLAAVSEPAIATMLGTKWLPAAPLVTLLALAMPFMTLHVMFAPATSAIGRPGIATRSAILGALIMPAAFLTGVLVDEARGIALAWLLGYPLLTAITAHWSLPIIGATKRQLLAALWPPVLAGGVMIGAVTAADMVAGSLSPVLRLVLLTATGGVSYGLAMLLFAPERLREVLDYARRRKS
ncbi:lipopolysaccharide biosynthesis protein [Novosphingobium sp.]|uniref:lipopolysaccharide biosynthesis protein n=1 Tax=Novosphingobium sp. TaxID=1874826 RepID=UPI0022BC00BA|nr:lipopolysaccharide biosynthesis protein [Novosphingobium sp.]MCZ8018547.1 lipopolysaccharide biosynthesis protein [Novosphingobium sp.]MCZ8033541.1 lipopolysaccharide biosynthesis protein [Novosphingobium sp.]MCZ8051996.1 lipopolysaccharide biosynthesis protein [Novosphingobium sp.]MCZ8060538.1 lipopolysaccharide biosynthesis protein [Novosphingobium sp.]MCZ8232180.1 lipopolysaccharide biosynthesis protein [Novosphingobium sp.]